MRLFLVLMTSLIAMLLTACAQRASISPLHGKSYRQIFYLQGSAPPVQLAPTTAEDAKRISRSRARRSGTSGSGRGRAPMFGGGASGGSYTNSSLE